MAETALVRDPVFSRTFQNDLLTSVDGSRLRQCLQCGTCSGICPFGYLMAFPPSKMITALRADMFRRVMDTDSVWLCVSCYACTALCPSQIPITSVLMTHAKEQLLLEGNIPAELQDALVNTQRYGNPLGESPRKRADWAKGLQPEINVLGQTKQAVDVLWFVGDYPSYHARVVTVSRALHRVFHALGVSFGILGPEENSDGDSQRLAGERGLFEMLAEKNGRAMGKYKFHEIVTTDPHAYNALKHQYPALGISYPVSHYTEFLARRLDQLKPLLKREVSARVTYHDACYLGRVNGVYDEPRALLACIPGIQLVEMAHNHKTSLCCGGGGGGMWLDGFQWERAHARTSEWRVREALTAGATILAVACPYETPRFEDAVKTVAAPGQLVVKDIVELLAEAME